MRTRVRHFALAAISIGVAGCFYPPVAQPPAPAKVRTVVQVPYDLTWNAVQRVIVDNDYKLEGDDPDHGILEAEGHTFTLADADCGQEKSIASRYDAEPLPGSSAVYSFKIDPAGPQATSITVNATFNSPLHVPLRRVTDFQCVSRGTQEARLLKEIETAAANEHRPPPTSTASDSGPPPEPKVLMPGRPTLMREQLTEPQFH